MISIKFKCYLPIVLVLIFVFGICRVADAEEFKVICSYRYDAAEEPLVKDMPNIDVDLSGIKSEKKKAKRVAERVLRRELKYSNFGISFRLRSKRQDGEAWQLFYNWGYTLSLKSIFDLTKPFHINVDLKKRSVTYEHRKKPKR